MLYDNLIVSLPSGAMLCAKSARQGKWSAVKYFVPTRTGSQCVQDCPVFVVIVPGCSGRYKICAIYKWLREIERGLCRHV